MDPPDQAAANASQVIGLSLSPRLATSRAASLRPSSGRSAQACAARRQSAPLSAELPRSALKLRHPHHTASLRGSRKAQKDTASSSLPCEAKRLAKSDGSSSVGWALTRSLALGKCSK